MSDLDWHDIQEADDEQDFPEEVFHSLDDDEEELAIFTAKQEGYARELREWLDGD